MIADTFPLLRSRGTIREIATTAIVPATVVTPSPKTLLPSYMSTGVELSTTPTPPITRATTVARKLYIKLGSVLASVLGPSRLATRSIMRDKKSSHKTQIDIEASCRSNMLASIATTVTQSTTSFPGTVQSLTPNTTILTVHATKLTTAIIARLVSAGMAGTATATTTQGELLSALSTNTPPDLELVPSRVLTVNATFMVVAGQKTVQPTMGDGSMVSSLIVNTIRLVDVVGDVYLGKVAAFKAVNLNDS
nr:hypothetical protein HmN_000959800 [Hymenolepis microstoma]